MVAIYCRSGHRGTGNSGHAHGQKAFGNNAVFENLAVMTAEKIAPETLNIEAHKKESSHTPEIDWQTGLVAGTMLLEKIKSESLAHLSYIVGHGGRAAVIDPRRDCEIYVRIAHQNGAKITHIFETHRNEDYVIGSSDLSRRTGAEIFHGKNLNFAYGNPVVEGDAFDFGDVRLKILETPGHTFESISIALLDKSFGDQAIGVFTGDCLFIGSVGRTDFFPDRAREVAGLQYDSIFDKILPLGALDKADATVFIHPRPHSTRLIFSRLRERMEP